MRITNFLNLPRAFENLAKSDYTYTDKRYSVTQLLKPTREAILIRRHNDEIEQDVADCIWLVWGSAVHKVLEAHNEEGFAELKLEHKLVNGYTVSGILDLYNEETGEVVDYKTASIYKI